MSGRGINPSVSEYYILWEALISYESRLEKFSEMSTDEDKQLEYDEKLQDIEGIKKSLEIAAKNEFELELK
ncbi:hypothetical protein MNBD_GAMMA12-610 [hydrothermal vent metagenome]|uniref:Uncharacterized protein n=1 Tax=hydrothermal vent metagenome TaxID=652676 RepID=A0A3B0Z777_9ZZZZ